MGSNIVAATEDAPASTQSIATVVNSLPELRAACLKIKVGCVKRVRINFAASQEIVKSYLEALIHEGREFRGIWVDDGCTVNITCCYASLAAEKIPYPVS